MTIEHTADLRYRYQISRDDPCVIERKPNKPYARYTFYARRDSAKEAKQALLAIQTDEDEEWT